MSEVLSYLFWVSFIALNGTCGYRNFWAAHAMRTDPNRKKRQAPLGIDLWWGFQFAVTIYCVIGLAYEAFR